MGVAWLVILFVGVVFWAFRPRMKRRSDDQSRPPFDDKGPGGA